MIKKQPNFYIIGAPKCGTTSLAYYLNQHPHIFICEPKEPGYWASDLPTYPDFTGFEIKILDDYLSLFSKADDKVVAIGDASTQYSWSNTALTNILQFNPHSKFIFMVRNPVDLVVSLHREELYSFAEDVKDFATAWDLQEARAHGDHIPSTCRAPQKLQYRMIASLGSHLERMRKIIGTNNLLVIILDDLYKSPREVYLQTLSFLNVGDDGRVDFPKVNAAKQYRFESFAKFLRRPPKSFQIVFNTCRNIAWYLNLRGLRTFALRLLTTKSVNNYFEPSVRKMLTDEFEQEIDLLARLTERDLSHWKDNIANNDQSTLENCVNQ